MIYSKRSQVPRLTERICTATRGLISNSLYDDVSYRPLAEYEKYVIYDSGKRDRSSSRIRY